MKKRIYIRPIQRTVFVAIFIGIFLPAGNVHEAQGINESPAVKPSSSQIRIQRAKATWPGFVRKFRAALRNRDRDALYRMSSEKLNKNCLDEQGRDIRQEFFADDGSIGLCLDIISPGRHGKFRSKLHSPNYDKHTDVILAGAEMNPCAWSLGFEYREQSGWRFTWFGQTCEGC